MLINSNLMTFYLFESIKGQSNNFWDTIQHLYILHLLEQSRYPYIDTTIPIYEPRDFANRCHMYKYYIISQKLLD